MITYPNDRAFPHDGVSYGLTKRELFAAMAMQGMIAGGNVRAEKIAGYSVAQANALIAALNEVKP